MFKHKILIEYMIRKEKLNKLNFLKIFIID